MRKKLLSLSFILFLITASLIQGCRFPNDKEMSELSPTADEQDNRNDTLVIPSYHVAERLSFSSKYENVVFADDCFFASYIDGPQLGIAVLDSETGTEKKSFTLPASSADYYVQNMTVDTENNLYALTTGYDYLTEPLLWRINTNGNVTACSDFELTDMEYASFPTLKGIQIGEDGTFYLWYSLDLPLSALYEEGEDDIYKYIDRIYIMPEASSDTFYVQTDKELQNFFLGTNGNPLLITYDNTENQACIQKIDMEKQKLSEDVVYLKDADNSPLNLSGNLAVTEDGFYFCQNENLYHYYYATGQTEYTAALSSFGIMADNILSFRTGENGFEIIDSYHDAPGYTLIEKGSTQKQILTLGTFSILANPLNQVIADFNRNNPDVEVIMYDYNHHGRNTTDAVEQLKLDIISGTAPDILDCSMCSSSFLTSKGVLLDLYPYMDKDADINRDSFLPSVINAYELDGHLYTIASSFNLHSMWGSQTVWGSRQGLTLQELQAFLQSQGKNFSAIFGFSADEPVLTTMCTFGMNSFIDWNHFTCDFTSDYFKDMLTFTKEYTTGNVSYSSELAGIREGDILLSVGIIPDIAYCQYLKQLYEDNITYVGYPTDHGSGTAVTWLNELGINAACQNPDAAWQFLSYFASNGYDGLGIPVLKTTFDEMMEAAMTDDYSLNEDGTFSSTPAPKTTYSNGDEYFLIYAASQKDVNDFRALIDTADTRYEYNTAVMTIIAEEAEAYFAGQKDIENTVQIIQNRVSLYLTEQMP